MHSDCIGANKECTIANKDSSVNSKQMYRYAMTNTNKLYLYCVCSIWGRRGAGVGWVTQS